MKPVEVEDPVHRFGRTTSGPAVHFPARARPLRATTIWEAFELDKKRIATGKRVVIKEAWRQFVRPSEIDFYLTVQEAIEEVEEGVVLSQCGIADLEYGDDLGLREAKDLDKDAITPSEDDEYTGDFPRLKVPCSWVLGHRTISAGRRAKGIETDERAQMRLVFNTVGRQITDFDSTYEVVSALRDAIEGHRRAYEAGVLHRDVSRGNIMMGRRPDGTSFGFLHDFDYASNWKVFLASKNILAGLVQWEQYARKEYGLDWRERVKGWSDNDDGPGDELLTALDHSDFEDSQPSSSDSSDDPVQSTPNNSTGQREQPNTKQSKFDHKQRTGTLYFMAVEVLDENFSVTHEARHDLESFYWLLVWIVLRHTAYHHINGDRAWHALFDAPTIEICRGLKIQWLVNPSRPLEFKKNPNLTWLLEQFRNRCQTNYDNVNLENTCMTHKQVLDLFDRALKNRRAWPKNDRAKAWTPPKGRADEPDAMRKRSGQLRTKGTLTYTSQGAGRSASERAAQRRAEKRPAAPSPTPSDSDAQSDGQAGGISLPDANVPNVGASKRGAASGAVRGKRRPAALHTLTTSPHTSGGHEVPPSTNSNLVQKHPRYNLRSAKTKDTFWPLADPVFKPSCYRARCEAEEGSSATKRTQDAQPASGGPKLTQVPG
ncbi:uncharacterized protein B0H18DRAFT_1212573 [Fomitopsis serialis]|uniref:uncharacterized protein n=1 Tax=Fomitopsis serialis TaxID=139415 RepID=UPI002008104C|nr:uncharacterized protein B0H18DRAFT_1212573 [Neoantrodia serialis]KAH9922495.1 hypothetical protein B0H18DRAFT_1212573 [Neoantrodia serialis]